MNNLDPISGNKNLRNYLKSPRKHSLIDSDERIKRLNEAARETGKLLDNVNFKLDDEAQKLPGYNKYRVKVGEDTYSVTTRVENVQDPEFRNQVSEMINALMNDLFTFAKDNEHSTIKASIEDRNQIPVQLQKHDFKTMVYKIKPYGSIPRDGYTAAPPETDILDTAKHDQLPPA